VPDSSPRAACPEDTQPPLKVERGSSPTDPGERRPKHANRFGDKWLIRQARADRCLALKKLPSLPGEAFLHYILNMTLQDALATLRRHESALRERGVAHAAVFGSVVRGDDRPDSDVDILVEFEPGAEGTIYDYMRFKDYVASLFQGPVDVIDRAALKPHLRAPSSRDAVYAF
jgi:predicted nucleotidyltransferase